MIEYMSIRVEIHSHLVSFRLLSFRIFFFVVSARCAFWFVLCFFTQRLYIHIIFFVRLQAQFNLFVSIYTVALLIDSRYSSEHGFVCKIEKRNIMTLKQCAYYVERRIHQLNWNGIKFIMKCMNMSHVNNENRASHRLNFMRTKLS